MVVLNSLLGFLLMLGPLVMLHELGHYLVGRWCGVHAEAFSVGFGKEIFGWTDRRGTRWKISWLPLGGYVKFAGDMNAASMPIDEIPLSLAERERSFQFKPLWQRAAIVAAGPVTNLLIALVIFAGFNMAFGLPVAEPVIDAFVGQSAAQASGLKLGDRILSVDGDEISRFSQVTRHVLLYPGQTIAMTIERGGARMVVPVKIGSYAPSGADPRAGKMGFLGIEGRHVTVYRDPYHAVTGAFRQCGNIVETTVAGLRQIIFGQRSVRELGGPVKIAGVAGQALSLGWLPFVEMAAFISINLAFINLLPIPALDGGHLAFYLVEAVRRKALTARSQEWAFRTGLAFLLALIVFVTINDVVPASLFGS
ncbi:MAG: RIP metalloprotease RseP [Sphingomonadales bacterium]|nr:RIP metalloprotease RseP [Sphingomonadales bacterium]MDE2169105.1 RIP metalloprotease RseP [Sphingomonadales bacterium]